MIDADDNTKKIKPPMRYMMIDFAQGSEVVAGVGHSKRTEILF
jgi:hypothetical protein